MTQVDRRRRPAAEVPQTTWGELLRRVRGGEQMPQAAALLGLTAQTVHAACRRRPERAAELDVALRAGRDPGIEHGTTTGYRRHRCRCPDCRLAHHDPVGREVRRLYQQKNSVSHVARGLQVSRARARRLLAAAGIELPRGRGNRRTYGDAVRREVAERYQAGEWTPEIAASLGMTAVSAQRILREMGIPMRPTGSHLRKST